MSVLFVNKILQENLPYIWEILPYFIIQKIQEKKIVLYYTAAGLNF